MQNKEKNPSTTVIVCFTTICTEKEEMNSSFFNNLLGRFQTRHRSYKKLLGSHFPIQYFIPGDGYRRKQCHHRQTGGNKKIVRNFNINLSIILADQITAHSP